MSKSFVMPRFANASMVWSEIGKLRTSLGSRSSYSSENTFETSVPPSSWSGPSGSNDPCRALAPRKSSALMSTLGWMSTIRSPSERRLARRLACTRGVPSGHVGRLETAWRAPTGPLSGTLATNDREARHATSASIYPRDGQRMFFVVKRYARSDFFLSWPCVS
eukprot:11304_6